jgi:hypothetical protein
MKYLNPIKTNNSIGLNKFTHARIKDDKDYSKTFINCKKIEPNFVFDHGNHVPSTTYISSKLYLIHYHCRSHDQLIKKTTDNVVGLEYPLDVTLLRELLEQNVCGSHHISRMIKILENSDCNFEPELEEEIKDHWTYIGNILLL